MKHDIFISYSRKDYDIVAPIVEEMRSIGLDVWLDLSNIDYGKTFTKEIATAIEESDTFILMYSDNAEKAEFCQKEIDHAKANEKNIYAILLDGIMPKQGWFGFSYRSVNCVNILDSKQKIKLFDELKLRFHAQELIKRKELQDDWKYLSRDIKRKINEQKELISKMKDAGMDIPNDSISASLNMVDELRASLTESK